jgi:endonuclease YncB( thermonuclease family)
LASPAFGEPVRASVNPGPGEWKIIESVDGDTFKVDIGANLPKSMNTLSVRVFGIDTPEKGGRAKCQDENRLAILASSFTKGLITDEKNVITIDPIGWDKFGGRFDAKVSINGVALDEMLIKMGLAKRYHGEKKSSWCN